MKKLINPALMIIGICITIYGVFVLPTSVSDFLNLNKYSGGYTDRSTTVLVIIFGLAIFARGFFAPSES